MSCSCNYNGNVTYVGDNRYKCDGCGDVIIKTTSPPKRQKTTHDKICQLSSDLFMLEEDFKEQKKEIESLKDEIEALYKQIDMDGDKYINESNELHGKIDQQKAEIESLKDKIDGYKDGSTVRWEDVFKKHNLYGKIDQQKAEIGSLKKQEKEHINESIELHGRIAQQRAEHSKEVNFYQQEMAKAKQQVELMVKKKIVLRDLHNLSLGAVEDLKADYKELKEEYEKLSLKTAVSLDDFGLYDQEYIIKRIKTKYAEVFDEKDIKLYLSKDKKDLVAIVKNYVTRFPIKHNIYIDYF